MLNRHSKYIDQIKIEFDRKFINSLSLLTKRKIEPIIINKDAEEIIIGIKCPVIMDEETFDGDKKIIESDVLKAFADILNSDVCNREKIDTMYNRISKKRKLKYKPIPCPICGNINTIRHGHRMTNIGLKSTHFCKQCNKYYTDQENAIWKMKNSRQFIEEAIELSKQFSLREAARKIREKYNIKISHGAILIWRRNKSESLKNLDEHTKIVK